jgi:hypothetical protein
MRKHGRKSFRSAENEIKSDVAAGSIFDFFLAAEAAREFAQKKYPTWLQIRNLNAGVFLRRKGVRLGRAL